MRLGAGYCEDACYNNGKSCASCLMTSGCIWLENITYTNPGTHPNDITEFCAIGNMRGPKSYKIPYKAEVSSEYSFTVDHYFYLSCRIDALGLKRIAIAVSISVIILVFLLWIIVIVIKRLKYAKLVKAAEKLTLTSDQKQELDADDGNFTVTDFLLTMQTVPWED